MTLFATPTVVLAILSSCGGNSDCGPNAADVQTSECKKDEVPVGGMCKTGMCAPDTQWGYSWRECQDGSGGSCCTLSCPCEACVELDNDKCDCAGSGFDNVLDDLNELLP